MKLIPRYLLAVFIVLISIGTPLMGNMKLPDTVPRPPGGSSTEFHFSPSATQKLTIHGSSTINNWSCQTQEVSGTFLFQMAPEKLFPTIDQIQQALDAGEPVRVLDRFPENPPYIRIKIPIKSFDCGRKAMNEDMYEALKADSKPNIEFRFYRIKAFDTGPSKNRAIRLQVVGGMSMANVGRTVELPVEIFRTGPRQFRIKGSVPMKMTRFNVTPPTALFGLIKAYDKITIGFDLKLEFLSES